MITTEHIKKMTVEDAVARRQKNYPTFDNLREFKFYVRSSWGWWTGLIEEDMDRAVLFAIIQCNCGYEEDLYALCGHQRASHVCPRQGVLHDTFPEYDFELSWDGDAIQVSQRLDDYAKKDDWLLKRQLHDKQVKDVKEIVEFISKTVKTKVANVQYVTTVEHGGKKFVTCELRPDSDED